MRPLLITGGYRELVTREEIDAAYALADSWKHPEIPERQWRLNRAEREQLSESEGYRRVAPFRAFGDALRLIELPRESTSIRLLEIGCSSGYYHEVLRSAGYSWEYVGIDYAVAFREWAARVLPHVTVEIGDARALPYPDEAFEVVVSSGCLLHMKEWRQGIAEAARVCSRYLLFHRTPLLASKPTTHWLKEAYGVPCFEIWFNRDEFRQEVARPGLAPVGAVTVSETTEHGGYGSYSLLYRTTR